MKAKTITKKITAVLLIAVLLMPSVFADGEGIKTLSLSEAIATARANSREIESADYEIKSSEYGVDAAEWSKYDYRKLPAGSVEILYIKRGYYLEAANVSLKLAKLKKEQTNDKIAYTVTENYYNCVLAEKLIGIAENTYNLALSNKQAVDKYFELGMVSELEVKNAELAVKSASYAKENYTRNLDVAKINLNISMGVSPESEYQLTDTIVIPEITVDLENETKAALTSRYDMNAAAENKKLADLYFTITKKFYTNNTSPYYSAYSKMITAENSYETALSQMELYIRTLYNSMLSAKTAVEIAEGTYEIEKTEYEAAKLKFEMGMITNMELTSALNDMDKAEIELEQARLSQLLAIKKYGYEIKLGL